MKATNDGVSCSRAELTALLAYASQDSADKNKWGVLFTLEGEKVYARATNGFAFLQLEGISERKGKKIDWMVNRKYLVDCQKEIESKQVVCLEFKGASLHEAVVRENDKDLGRWQAAEDATVRQVAFPWEYENIGIPSVNRAIAHSSAISTPYLKLVMLAAKAVGVEEAHWYAPAEAHGALVFTVGHDKQTSAIGYIKPLPAKGADGAGDDDSDADDAEEAA